MVAPRYGFEGRPTLATVLSQEGFREMLALAILLPKISTTYAPPTRLVPGRTDIAVLDVSIVRGRLRRSLRLLPCLRRLRHRRRETSARPHPWRASLARSPTESQRAPCPSVCRPGASRH